MSVFDISPEEVRSFEGGFYRFTEIPLSLEPIRLVRLSDSRAGKNGYLGRYWFYGSEFAEILATGPSWKSLIKEVSQRWAICDDWGDKANAWFMDIPKGQRVPAAWGRTQFQPKISAKTQDSGGRRTRHSYAGGSLQIIIPIVDTDHRENPTRPPNAYLASLVTGPYSTDILAASPKRFLP